MFTALTLIFGCVGVALGAAASLTDPDNSASLTDVGYNSNGVQNSTNEDPLHYLMNKVCRGSYTAFCLKLNLIRLVGHGGGSSFSLFPGLSISSAAVPEVSNSISSSELLQDPDVVDGLLLSRLSDYLSSLSLNVKIMDKATPLKIAKSYMGDPLAASARKRKYGGALLAAGLMSGGTLLAAGLAALAALSGKAMMASLLALMLAALSALKGHGGGGGGKTTYEVISKPVVSHLHTHSSEVQHAGHGHYRSITSHDDVAYSDQAHDVAHDIAYAEQAPHAQHAPVYAEQPQQVVSADDYLPTA